MHDGNFTGGPLPPLGSCRADTHEPTPKKDLTFFNITFLTRNFSLLDGHLPLFWDSSCVHIYGDQMRRTRVDKRYESGGTNLFNCLALLFACIVLFYRGENKKAIKEVCSSFDKRAMAIKHAFLTLQIFRWIFRRRSHAGWAVLYTVMIYAWQARINMSENIEHVCVSLAKIPTGL